MYERYNAVFAHRFPSRGYCTYSNRKNCGVNFVI